MNNIVAMDQNHAEFIYGCLVAKKPEKILEMGVGVGFVTKYLIKGIKYNQFGELICVDNWLDTGGQQPNFFKELLPDITTFELASEGDFVSASANDTYDLSVYDADHFATDQRIDDILRITNHEGFLFFHDIMTQDFSNLYKIVERVRELGMPNYIFDKSTRTDERCERGLLFVIKP